MNDLAHIMGFALLSDEEQEPETLELGANEADSAEDDEDVIDPVADDDDDEDEDEVEEEVGGPDKEM
jgi:hypothetical protein